MCHDGGVSIVVSGSPDFGVRERLEARCEALKSQTVTLVEATVTQLLLSRDRVERETVGQLRPALRELRREDEPQPERKRRLPPDWKRFRAEEIKELNRTSQFVVPTANQKEKQH